jgi:hypothetical protein
VAKGVKKAAKAVYNVAIGRGAIATSSGGSLLLLEKIGQRKRSVLFAT